jgi:uncharacterized RDD family membrane protein YckC
MTAAGVPTSETAELGSAWLYARLSRRVRAIVIDGLIYTIALAGSLLLLDALDAGRALIGATAVLCIAFFLLYEAILVSRRGATIGHKYANCRVIDLRNGENPGFWRAWGRFWVKGIAGVLAVIFMPLTRRHQALHDIMFDTAVVIADPATAESWQYVREQTPDSLDVRVPVWRRIAVIAGYSAAGFLAYGAMLLAVQSPACINLNQCTGADDLWRTGLGYAWLGSQILWIILGWLGRLPGARSKRAGPASPEPRAA